MTDTRPPRNPGRWDRFLAEWSLELALGLGLLFVGLSLLLDDAQGELLERIVIAVIATVFVVRLVRSFVAGYRDDA